MTVASDGEPQATLTLLLEVGSSPASQRLRVTFAREGEEEVVRLEEVQYGKQWYSYDARESGAWTVRELVEVPDVTEHLDKLAWLVKPWLIVRGEGRQDLGITELNGLPARLYRYGSGAVREEWLQTMDLPGLESATIDVWVGVESNRLLAMEVDSRCLTYSGKVRLRARLTLREVGPQVEVRRPPLCVDIPLPPDVALPTGAEGIRHECASWTYRMAGSREEVVQAHRRILEGRDWHYAEEESYYPDYVAFRKGVRRIALRVDAQDKGIYVLLTAVQAAP